MPLRSNNNSLGQTGIHDVPLFNSSSGVIDSIDPVRLGEDALAKAENVVLDISGAIKRRDGMVLLSSSNCHSLFSCGKYGLGVFNGVLSLVESDLSITSLVTVGSDRVSYALVFDGMDDVVFFSSRSINGKVVNKVYAPWLVDTPTAINSTLTQIGEWHYSTPKGQLLEIFNGRMYIASNNILYFSELYDFSQFRSISPFIFDKDITMLHGISTGMFVGTLDAVYFLHGVDPNEFALKRVYSAGAVLGTSVKLSASDILSQTPGDVIVFSINGKGICIGDSGGNVSNLTKVPISFPKSTFGACCVNKDNQYIVSLASSGG